MERDHSVAARRQHGVALLTLMLIIFLATTAFYLRQSSGSNVRRQSDAATSRAMAQAKEALIGRAATDMNRPGSLPCPDVDDDGVAELLPGNHCPSYVGRLPWKTLDIPEPLDGNGDRLWYALSPGLRDSSAAQPINPGKALELTLDGVVNVAAIVFSPGPPLPGQTGRPDSSLADYLDGRNADGDTHYVAGPVSALFNDRALAITRDDVFRVVNRRVLAEIRGPQNLSYGLRNYYAANKQFPLADSEGDGIGDSTGDGRLPYKDLTLKPELVDAATFGEKAWLTNNGWLPLVGYRRIAGGAVSISLPISSLDSTTLNVQPCPTLPCP